MNVYADYVAATLVIVMLLGLVGITVVFVSVVRDVRKMHRRFDEDYERTAERIKRGARL